MPQDLTFGQGRNQTKFGFSPASFTENLTKFETEESVQAPSNFPHVISVVESERIACAFKVKESDYAAGDIVLWDGEKKVVIDSKWYLPSEEYTPIGVVVIPASHMDDGKARMMSTRWMSCNDPENGSVVPETMVWGTDTDLTGLTNYTQIPVIARYDDENNGGVTALTKPQEIYTAFNYAFFPSDNTRWTGEINTEDNETKWFQSSTYLTTSGTVNAYNFYAPSPYAFDGTPNSLYRETSYSGGSLNNSFSYFDGRHQTDVILEARGEKDYGSWKPTAGTPEDFPAVSVCDMYHTVGTNQGDWYLPSAAETGYIVARLNRINTAVTKVNGMHSLPLYRVWSSTEYNASQTRILYFSNGLSNWHTKNSQFNPVVAYAEV